MSCTRTACFASALVFAVLLAPSTPSAQVVLNEILPNPAGDDVGTERIEIVNAGPTSVDVTGWAIDDAATIDEVGVRCRIPEDFDTSVCSGSAILAPGEFRVVKGTSTAAFLNNSGDDVYLIKDRTLAPVVADLVTYPSAALQVDMTWGAIPNGSENFAWRTKTLCGSNGGAGDFIAPSTIADLAAVSGAYSGEVRLTWTAPGDDGMTGTASAYEFKVALSSINAGNFDTATDLEFWINAPLPQAAGTAETLVVFGLDPAFTWHFAVKAVDDAANLGAVSNSPSALPLAGALPDPNLGGNVYFGNLHAHTGYSDGQLTPADAYSFARNTAPTPLDFLAVTDHNHAGAGMSLPNYSLGLAQAAAANDDGNFVAIYGQEWGFASNGHVNILEAPVLFGWEAGNYDVFVAEGDYPSLYTAALANPPASYPVVLLWCHPAASDFDNLAVTSDGLAAVHLMCLVNGPAFSTATDETDVGNTGFDDVFHEALRKGYRVSPTADQDNHNVTWGASSQSRTAAHASTKSKAAILGALAAGNNYATQDHNARVDFTADGHGMGEAFTATSGVRIAVRVTDPDVGETVSLIELFRGIQGVSSAVRVAWNADNNELHWRELEEFADGTEVHYTLRIRQGDNHSIWTGPAYITYQSATGVADGASAPASAIRLASPTPNPTRGATRMAFALPRDVARVRATLFDVEGRLTRVLLDRPLGAGNHEVRWDGGLASGRQAPPGIYLLRLDAGDEGSATAKIHLLR
ncbi:MAG: CehA/McbA family metallohydrolase [bacterium]